MSPSVLPENPSSDSSYQPATSRKWLVQVAFLFGLLVLGRGSRPVAAPLLTASVRVPYPATKPPKTAPLPQHLPTYYPTVTNVSFFRSGQ